MFDSGSFSTSAFSVLAFEFGEIPADDGLPSRDRAFFEGLERKQLEANNLAIILAITSIP